MAALSFDSGALIALDRGDIAAWAWFKRAVERGAPPLVSTTAIAEAWRDGRVQAQLARVLRACEVRPCDDRLARAAGEALRVVDGGAVDAIIAATAADAGALLLTGDPKDMRALADRHFHGLRVAFLPT